jgi:hypothetical protein
MKPLYHLVFAVAFTLAVSALFLPLELGWQLVLLAAVSGILPDFDHWLALWKGVAAAVFVALFAFFAGALENSFQGQFETLLFAGAAALAVSVLLLVLKPFQETIFDLRPGKTRYAAHGLLFLVLYTLVVFAATNSLEYAAVAFLAYFSHLLLDFAAYETRFGRRYLAGWSEWWKPEEYHVERLKRERAKQIRAKKDEQVGTK